MKMRSRLTALLLALLMALSTAAPALAATVLPLTEYEGMVKLAAQQEATEPVIIEGGEVYDLNDSAEEAASGYDRTNEVTLAIGDGEQDAALPVNGKLLLTSAIANGQWQVQVGDQWVNMHGETASTLEVTFAKVQSLFAMNNSAKIRHISADGAQVSCVASVGLDYSVQTLEEDVAMPVMASYKARMTTAANPTEIDPFAEPVKVLVEIAYKFEHNGENAASSYFAELPYDDDLTTSVLPLPVVEGYMATLKEGYLGNEVRFVQPTENANGTIQLTLKNVQTDRTFVVQYVPDYVDYTVEHLQMGPDAQFDTAVVVESVVKEKDKKTGEPVGAGLAKTYEGFHDLWYDETTTVAANGSTIIRVYYERNWYLILFDLDGGFGVEPIYAQYGVNINSGIPVKPGHTFLGWSTAPDGEVIDQFPTTMPCLDSTGKKITYYAQWEKNDTAPVTVVFWGETANSEEYDYLGSGMVNAKIGEEFTYTNETTLAYKCGLEEHTHGSGCVYACGKPEHQHSLANNCPRILICTETVHATHTTNCYANVGNRASPYFAPNNPVNGQIYRGTFYSFIYIGGNWYNYTGNLANGEIAPTLCHTHDDGCYQFTCTVEVHEHAEACRSCSKVEHRHTDECTPPDSAQNAHLWTLVRSETVTVDEDGSSIVNVYYDRTEFTLHFRRTNSNTDNYGTIRDKWGADISAEYVAIAENAGGTFWSTKSNGDTPYTNYIGIMPKNNATYYYANQSGSTGSMTYYGESLTNGDYSVKLFEVPNVGGYTVTDEDRYEFEGFTYHHGSGNGSQCRGATFYYTRNTYILDFNDGYSNVRTENVKYGAPLSTYENYIPSLPVNYEEGSMNFAGWYLNPECTGEEYDLSSHTMPAGNLILYAKWVPNYHDVAFYMDADALKHNTPLPGKYLDEKNFPYGAALPETITTSVLHGNMLPEAYIPIEDELEADNDPYDFIGWFYLDAEGNEKAFDPTNMPVRRELHAYAKWTVNEPINFIIYYREADTNGNALRDEDGNYIDVAAPTAGQALYGSTITIAAKTGTDLYAAYREGYFPHPPSHSVKLEIVDDGTGSYVNTFEFLYTKAESVPYKVMYVTRNADGTYTRLRDDKLVDKDQTKTIVTENYVHIPGYMPDAYQKRLIVMFGGKTDDDGNFVSEAEKGENLIIFYYQKSADKAIWTTTHFVESEDGTDWVQYGETISKQGEINKEQTAEKLNIEGFTYSKAELITYTIQPDSSVVTSDPINVTNDLKHALSSGGMDYKLYYTRNKYPVLVRYVDQDTDTEIAESHLYVDENGMSVFPYQSKVNVSTDKTFEGYTMVSPNPQEVQSVQVDGDGTQENPILHNVVTFYFIEPEADVDYVVVGLEGCGTVRVNKSDAVASDKWVREDVKIKNGTAVGATAASSDETLFTFVGWYSDANCTNLLSTEASYVPVKPANQTWPEKNVFYAKFEEVTAKITYAVVGPDGCGTVDLKDSNTATVPTTEVEEEFGRVTGTAVGATAAPTSNVYKFVGWYSADDQLLSTAADYIPQQPSHVDAVTGETVLDPWPTSSAYYAKFEYNLTSLTIVKDGYAETASIDPNQTFIFRVTGGDLGDGIMVSIDGDGSKTISGLTVGVEYTVTEMESWSWRYDSDSSKSITLQPSGNTVTINNTREHVYWLDGNAVSETNVYGN